VVVSKQARKLKEREVGGKEKLFSIPNKREVGKLKNVATPQSKGAGWRRIKRKKSFTH
jgi:hypothetical protein